MEYIITGGAGFIGSNLADALASDHDITIIDDLSTGRRENIRHLVDRGDVEFVEGSITDLALLEEVCTGVDGIFHQAAIPSVPRSVEDPLSTNEANVTGTLNILLAARKCGVRKVVCASSSSVYGDTLELPKHEEMAVRPLSPYAVSKLADEYYCRVFSDLFGIQTVCLRYFNVFGPRQDPASEYAAVIPKFITRLLSGQPPVIYGDGGQTRDFTFVKDVVNANILSMERDAEGVFNIARGSSMTLNDLAANLMELMGVDVEPEHTTPRAGDIRDSLADISRSRAVFGFEPEYDMREGLEETIEWFRNR